MTQLKESRAELTEAQEAAGQSEARLVKLGAESKRLQARADALESEVAHCYLS